MLRPWAPAADEPAHLTLPSGLPDSQGGFLSLLGGGGSEPGRFEVPSGVALDPEGNLHVAGSGNHRIIHLRAAPAEN